MGDDTDRRAPDAPGLARGQALRRELADWSRAQGHTHRARRRLLAGLVGPRAAPVRKLSLRWWPAAAGVTLLLLLPISFLANNRTSRDVGAQDEAGAIGRHVERVMLADGSLLVFAPGTIRHIAASERHVRLELGGVEADIAPASGGITMSAGPFAVAGAAQARVQVVWDRSAGTLSVAMARGQATVAGTCLDRPRRLSNDEQARFSCPPHGLVPHPLARTRARADTSRFAAGTAAAGRPSATTAVRAALSEDADEGSSLSTRTQLIGLWRFDQGGTALTVPDASGRGHEVSLETSPEGVTAALEGEALNPMRAVAVAPASPDLDELGKALSITAWVHRDRDGLAFDMIASRQWGKSDGEHFALGCYQNRLVFLLGTRPPEITVIDWGLFPNGRWAHVAATYDGTTAVLYLDGAPVATRAVSRRVMADDTPLVVGGNANGSARRISETWHGRVAELRLYHGALRPDEVRALARSQPKDEADEK